MPPNPVRASAESLDHLTEEVARRSAQLSKDDRGSYVGSELPAMDRVLARIQTDALVTGSTFCEWGSGLGGVCGVATLNGFDSFGIEIEPALVESARGLALDLDLRMAFAEGTFLLPGDEDLMPPGQSNTHRQYGTRAWNGLGLKPADCDVVFAYPWPGEEAFLDCVFSRHVTAGTLLLTFHGFGRVLVQRKVSQKLELETLAWM